MSTYEPKYWYCESLWMVHRLFFTGVILIVYPETRVQIWAGAVMGLFVYVAFMMTRASRVSMNTCIAGLMPAQ